nr:hypothetical protein K-LCC10_0353 [Kaumoebavirus]
MSKEEVIKRINSIYDNIVKDYSCFELKKKYEDWIGSVIKLHVDFLYLGQRVAHLAIIAHRYDRQSGEYKGINIKYTQPKNYPSEECIDFIKFEELTWEHVRRYTISMFNTLEYQNYLLVQRIEKLEEIVQQLLYAPGGPRYQEAKAHFESHK